jgi:hypothetical protein
MSQQCKSLEMDRQSGNSYLRIAAMAVLAAVVYSGAALAAPQEFLYNSVPSPLPPNVPSEPFQAGHKAEFGDEITFAGTARDIGRVTIILSDWSVASAYPSFPGAGGATWNHSLTLNLYNVDSGGANPPQHGTLIASRTGTYAIPWRPAADPTCADPTNWRAGDGNCYGGIAFSVAFDFTGTTVPDQIIYGLAFNTSTFGAAPIGVVGPYDGLNIGLAQVPPTTGTNPFPDSAFVNATDNPGYHDGGAGGTGTFRRDPSTAPTPATTWAPYSGAITFEVGIPSAAPVPTLSSLALLLLALAVTLIAVGKLRFSSRAQ